MIYWAEQTVLRAYLFVRSSHCSLVAQFVTLSSLSMNISTFRRHSKMYLSFHSLSRFLPLNWANVPDHPNHHEKEFRSLLLHPFPK